MILGINMIIYIDIYHYQSILGLFYFLLSYVLIWFKYFVLSPALCISNYDELKINHTMGNTYISEISLGHMCLQHTLNPNKTLKLVKLCAHNFISKANYLITVLKNHKSSNISYSPTERWQYVLILQQICVIFLSCMCIFDELNCSFLPKLTQLGQNLFISE